MCVCVCVSHLLAHGVDAIRSEQVHRLLHQVRASAVEHPEAQVLEKFGLGGRGVQFPRRAETVVGPRRENGACGETLFSLDVGYRDAFSVFPE